MGVKTERTRTKRWIMSYWLLGCSTWLAYPAVGVGSLLLEVPNVSVAPGPLDVSSYCPRDILSHTTSNGHMSTSSELERRGLMYGISSPRFNYVACWERTCKT